MSRKANISIPVNENLERASRKFKKLLEREGITRDIKRTVYFESKAQKKRKRFMRAVKQNLIRMAAHNLI